MHRRRVAFRASFRAAAFLVAVVLAAAGARAQGDPLEGAWEGFVTSPRARMPVVARISRDAATGQYGGTITGYQAGTETPLIEVRLQGSRVALKFELQSPRGNATVRLQLALARDTLKGKTEATMGGQKMTLDYELKRTGAGSVPASAPAGPAVPPEEAAEFQRLLAEQDPAARKNLIDAFAARFPSSLLLADAFQEAAIIGRMADDPEVLFEYGQKSLQLRPNNFVLMSEIADAYLRRNQPDKAEPLALEALELLGTAQKPPALSDADWVKGKRILLGTNFATLGFAHIRRAQASKNPVDRWRSANRAIAPLKRALEFQPREDSVFYGLGFSYAMANDYANAESALAKAVVLNGPTSGEAKNLLQDIYKSRNKSLDGLEQVLANARTDLALP